MIWHLIWRGLGYALLALLVLFLIVCTWVAWSENRRMALEDGER